MRMRDVLLSFLALFTMLTCTAGSAVELQIPGSHPRLWFGNSVRLQQARTYFQNHPFSPGSSDFYEKALRGLLTGALTDCSPAAHYMRDWQASAGIGGFRDDIRQQGEDLLLMYDWCHASLTAAEISMLVDRWNGYMDRQLADNLGNEGKEANNYWAGYTRNLLLWGIASYGENARAQEFIDTALDIRMGSQFSRWYGDFGRGGAFVEGDEYGVVSLSYPIIAFTSSSDFGYDPYEHTPYFREALYALVYGSTPGPSNIVDAASDQYSLFPFNDDEQFFDGGAINARDYLGDFATYVATRAPNSGNARHALAWQAASGAHRRWLFDALGTTGNANDLAPLPLDYFASGAAYFDMRTSQDAEAMQVHLQLGTPGGVEHRHLDGGSFQVWRKGRWLTRESTGYSAQIAPFGGGSGSIDSSDAPAHNGLLFEGRSTGIWIGNQGPVPIPPQGPASEQPRGLPNVQRLQHAAQFAYVATDYSDAYRNELDTRVDWPYADKAWREFLFIRPLHALLILDRTRGSSDSMRPYYSSSGNWLEDGPTEDAAHVHRTFVMHFETQPTSNGSDRLAADIGDQRSELIALIPSNAFAAGNPHLRIFNEDRPGYANEGQYRLELDSVGSAESYFLNVITGYDAGDAPLHADLHDEGDRWRIELSHPARGSAHVVLMKGMDSFGGSIQIDDGPVVPLNDAVQEMIVTSDGPVWSGGEAGDAIFASGFEF